MRIGFSLTLQNPKIATTSTAKPYLIKRSALPTRTVISP
jgi:hypothetical protein